MARGKPKGIRRKLAKNKQKLSEKLAVSQVGEVAEHYEFRMIKTIEEHLKYGVPKQSPAMRFVRRLLQTHIGLMVMEAVANVDAGFFDRCRDALQRPVPRDPSGVRVLEAVLQLATASGCRASISSGMILDEVQRRYPGEPPLDPKDVRDVLNGLGIKCPVSRDMIRAERAREWEEDRRLVQPLLESHPAGSGQQEHSGPHKIQSR